VAAARSTLVGIGLTTLTLAQGDPALATAAAVDLAATALGVT
jgi:hypothetical protein